MRRLTALALSLAYLAAVQLDAQTTRSSQIALKCRAGSRLSESGETIIYKKCSDGKTYISKDGSAFAELGTGVTEASWATRAYSAGNYTAGGAQTFTVESGDVVTETWMLPTSTSFVFNFNYYPASVGGTPHSDLQIALPVTSAVTVRQPIACGTVPLGTNAPDVCWALFESGSSTLKVQRYNFAVWGSDTDSVFIQGIVGPVKITP